MKSENIAITDAATLIKSSSSPFAVTLLHVTTVGVNL